MKFLYFVSYVRIRCHVRGFILPAVHENVPCKRPNGCVRLQKLLWFELISFTVIGGAPQILLRASGRQENQVHIWKTSGIPVKLGANATTSFILYRRLYEVPLPRYQGQGHSSTKRQRAGLCSLWTRVRTIAQKPGRPIGQDNRPMWWLCDGSLSVLNCQAAMFDKEYN